MLVQAQLLTVLHILLLHFVNEEQVSERKDDNKKIAPVLAFLRQNYREPVSLEATARKFFISEAHLSRRFRKELGVTFSEYLTALRLESARQDIIYSDESITRIALNNGFASTRSMSQYFQRIFGCPLPSTVEKAAATPAVRSSSGLNSAKVIHWKLWPASWRHMTLWAIPQYKYKQLFFRNEASCSIVPTYCLPWEIYRILQKIQFTLN